MRTLLVIVTAAACISGAAAKPAKSDKSPETDNRPFAETFGEKAEDLASLGKNTFFVLEPGHVMEYSGEEDGKKTDLVVTVLDETKKVDGVETRIVEERESSNGQVSEISRNYFAISKRTNSVYYFGEDSKKYKDGKPVGSEGSWESGIKGAHYGLMIPGTVLPGARHYQEFAPGEAMDRAEIVSITEKIKTPAGEFNGCMKTEETTPLEPGNKEYKIYAPGVGLVKDGGLLLVKYGAKDAMEKK